MIPNITGWSDTIGRLKDEKLDSLMDAALTEMDMDKAKDKWVEAQKQVNEDVSALPVYGNTYFDFYNKKIKNLKTSALYQWTHGLRDATIRVNLSSSCSVPNKSKGYTYT